MTQEEALEAIRAALGTTTIPTKEAGWFTMRELVAATNKSRYHIDNEMRAHPDEWESVDYKRRRYHRRKP